MVYKLYVDSESAVNLSDRDLALIAKNRLNYGWNLIDAKPINHRLYRMVLSVQHDDNKPIRSNPF